MARTNRIITLDPEVASDIQRRKKSYSFNFSAWVNSEYRSQFLSTVARKERIKSLEAEIAVIKEEMALYAEKEQAWQAGFSEPEKRFLQDVPRLLAEGFDVKALKDRFNKSFHRDSELSVFKKAVRFFDERRHKKS